MSARLSSPASWNVSWNGSYEPPRLVEESEVQEWRWCSPSELEAYAQRVLKSHAMEAPDESLGSYVTSLIRNSSNNDERVEDLPDFESLLELVQEHCACSESDALKALQAIATAVRTNKIPNETLTSSYSGVPSVEASRYETPSFFPGTFDYTEANNNDNFTFDSLGFVGDTSHSDSDDHILVHKLVVDENAFPPLGASHDTVKKTKPSTKPRSDNSTANSRIPDSAPLLQNSPPPPGFDPLVAPHPNNNLLHATTVEMLLSMNADLSEEAALAAAMESPQADVNVAQYLIDCVLAAPPVCRHLLQNGCYRSDCQFSHDIDNHTCLFWLKGRCGKGTQCRFLHGFDPRLLHGIQYTTTTTPPQQSQWDNGNSSSFLSTMQLPKQTTDLDYPPPSETLNFKKKSSTWKSGGTAAWGLDIKKNPSHPASFANVALQGTTNSKATFVDRSQPLPPLESPATNYIKKVDIPTDVWCAHENRDASVFHIADPMERYYAVAATRRPYRSDIIDLHFQSTKTFAIVLAKVLPEQLPNGHVWIVTGTGHHVGAKTHQKSGGALESAVMTWLTQHGYNFAKGRDRNGQAGALLVYNNNY